MSSPDRIAGKAVLVPAARVGRDVLADIFERRGAEVRRFPRLRGELLRGSRALLRALESIDRQDWVVFAGELAVEAFATGRGETPLSERLRVGTVGVGAAQALKKLGHTVNYSPRVHRPEEIADGMGPLAGAKVLLLRGDRAPVGLPRELESRGALVEDVEAFRVHVEASVESLRRATEPPLDLVAFANPSAVRLFAETLRELDIDPLRCLAAVPIASVGPLTTRVSTELGLEPDLSAEGHLADLVAALEELYSQ